MKGACFAAAIGALLMSSAHARANDQAADPTAAQIEDAVETLLQPQTGGAGVWEISVGADYSTGTYGAARATRVHYAPFGIGYRSGRWRFAADSGVLRVKGPVDYASILELSPGEVRDLGLEDDVSAGGLADTVLSAVYGAHEDLDRLVFIDVGARVKLPTASRSKGLGNGKLAVDLQVDAIKVAGPWSVMASASYGLRHRERGTRDTQSVSAGLGRTLSDAASVGALFEWRRASDPRARDGRDVIVYAAHRFNERVSLTAYGVRSLVAGGVEAQGGLRLTYRWR